MWWFSRSLSWTGEEGLGGVEFLLDLLDDVLERLRVFCVA